MVRYNERQTRQSRFSEDEEPRSTRRQPAGSRGSGRGRQQEPAVVYLPIFSLFGNEQRDGRLSIDIKAYDGKNGSIEDALTREEFLFFCGLLYDGEPLDETEEWGVKLTGSLWEMDNPTKQSTHSGNIRFSEEKIEQIKEAYAASLGNRKAKKTAAKAPAAARKPRYEVPEEDEDDDEYEEVVVKPYNENQGKKKRQSTPVKPAFEFNGGEETIEADVACADDEDSDVIYPPY